MAVIDKTDFWRNGKLAWAVNNLYYDLINVDVSHVPYATTHRNSSFFLKTRLWYILHEWRQWTYEVLDIHIIWDDTCTEENWTAYVLWKKWWKNYIIAADIENWVISSEFKEVETVWRTRACTFNKLISTNYVRDFLWKNDDFLHTIDSDRTHTSDFSWVQMNKYTAWTSVWLFTDMNVESWHSEFTWEITEAWNYLLIYQSTNVEWAGFAGQVRMITWVDDSDGPKRIMVDSPWLGFKILKTDEYKEWEENRVSWKGLRYAVFKEWWEVVWYAWDHDIYILTKDTTDDDNLTSFSVYNQTGWEWHTDIISVADANDKIFVLTDNWYVHYSSAWIWHNKFFIQDDMYAWVDKTSIVAYRDILVAFWRRHIAAWVPDDQNQYWTMYNQSTSMGIWSRDAYTEYDWDLLFVSNDKRLLALWIANNTGKYMLQHEDVWQMVNWKLKTMLPSDKVFMWADGNNLRIFVNTKRIPYAEKDSKHVLLQEWGNDMTHIYKFDTQFKVWTEDHINWILLQWAEFGIYYWQRGLYKRDLYKTWNSREYWYDYDWHEHPFETKISAFLMENEDNGLTTTTVTQPNLFMLAKLNRLITTLWAWKYSNLSKIHVLSYWQGIWVNYEFPVSVESWDDKNTWLWMVTKLYDWYDIELTKCQEEAIQDMQKKFKETCTNNLFTQALVQQKLWYDSYDEFLIQDHSVCINDRLYRLAPTMPLVTSLGEQQNYSTQIKVELISSWWDCISFWWWMAEMFTAPLWMTWADGEYELSPESDC